MVPADELERRLVTAAKAGKRLRVKLGVDPTASRVTLGWAVVLRRLRRFQDLGHMAVLIIGDFTARVGDPSGRSKTRPRLSPAQVDEFADSCLTALMGILSERNLEVRRNSEWLATMETEKFLWLTAHSTVARMLERDDFSQRYAAEAPISLIEFIYPLLQAYDSVMVEADVELGGNDQLFNLLVGREIQRAAGQEPQVCLTMPLLRGTDGVRKMSQSYGNFIAIDEDPGEMYGKVLSISDELIPEYLQLATDLEPAEVESMIAGIGTGALSPRDAKRRLARAIVELYHDPSSALDAEERFDSVFVRNEALVDAKEFRIPDESLVNGKIWICRLLADAGLARSNSEGRRLVNQGGVRLGGSVVTDPETHFEPISVNGELLTVGKRRGVRLLAAEVL